MSASGHDSGSPPSGMISLRVPTSPQARAKRRIATLMEEVELLKQDKATKQRKTTYYVSQGRAIRRLVALYTPIEDLIAENDRRCEYEDTSGVSTVEQDRLQRSYVELVKALPWIHDKIASLDDEESEDMLKKLKRGADSARGDDTGTLKELVASWVNIEFRPTPLISTNDKHHRGFVNDTCGKLLCPAEWCWDDPAVKASIRDRTTAFIVSENSWPLFMYQNCAADAGNLEHGLMKSKLLVMGLKALFTSPSSASEMDGEGQGTDIIENNRRARRQDQAKLVNITSWRNVDGDFDYEIFWTNIVDFFEDAPGPAARARVNELLEWWTRKVFGRNHRQDLTSDVISRMSVRTLAAQRLAMEDAALDSDS
ncbi:uncharacterized protein F5891DRAFT_1188921 [Suillus fuscotomentosus]|uniref:Uncharacterized protein n=1 Tax=Suillus fuscotomentosus TaxID=1912939 RepID=A0AAD4HLV4_9AGAM|nr:uncharacterized protein F5891DRAFT_1188921 [Suillus fuscotomentosus]KAG1900224.1 hypothetical protein F5891DRAFT_1188921 [Suillus fuscotomentosus]